MISAMRFMAVAAVLAGLTSAQGTLPSCAQSCVTEFTSGSNIGGCPSLNIQCICSSKDFIGGIACCLEGKCDAADQQAATNYAATFCAAAGVSGLPTVVSSACTSTASSTASAAPSSTSSSEPATTSSSSSSASSATSGVSSSASSVSSVSSSASSVSSSVSSAVSSVSSKVSSASSSASSAAASPTKNASPHNVAGLGAGVLGGLAAAVALL